LLLPVGKHAIRFSLPLALPKAPFVVSQLVKIEVGKESAWGDAVDGVIAIETLIEKPKPEEALSNLAVIGRYVLPPEIFDALRRTPLGKRGELELTDAMRVLGQDGVPIHGVVFSGRRYDTGDRQDYLRTVVRLACEHPDLGEDFTAWLTDFVRTLQL
jgi:UTP--glucose-1-phosphate uridylyltransferase